MLEKKPIKFNLIKDYINKIWEKEANILEANEIRAPFDMFKIHLIIYKRFEVLIEYDRSIIAISVKVNNDFVNLRKLTDQETVKGFSSSEEKSIIHNFSILDNTLKAM